MKRSALGNRCLGFPATATFRAVAPYTNVRIAALTAAGTTYGEPIVHVIVEDLSDPLVDCDEPKRIKGYSRG